LPKVLVDRAGRRNTIRQSEEMDVLGRWCSRGCDIGRARGLELSGCAELRFPIAALV
jgi:hypothetical protein